jgi:hypothetical protein
MLWQLSGMVYYMAGVTLTVAAYPKKVGVLAILFLALGDPFASSVGIKFGKLGPRFSNGKSLFGSLGGLTICALTTAIYFSRGVQDYLTLAIVSLLGGLAGCVPTTAELPPVAALRAFPLPFPSQSQLQKLQSTGALATVAGAKRDSYRSCVLRAERMRVVLLLATVCTCLRRGEVA